LPDFDYLQSLSILIAFASIFFVIIQLRDSTEQQKLNSRVELYKINRELLGLGFSNPELFEVLDDAENVDPKLERRYLQLWLNHFAFIHAASCRGLFPSDLRKSLERDMREFLSHRNMRRHWTNYGSFYPVEFQSYVKTILPQES